MIAAQPGPQEEFLSCDADIAIYGGAAGGGKTFALLLDTLRHIDVKNAGVVVFRRTFPEISNEGGLWDESTKIFPLAGAKARMKDMQWVFPRGFKVSFRHMQHEKDKYSYQGAQIPVIYWDELTHFTESQFFYMMSRNRSTSGIKPYIRGTCNPGPGWVKTKLLAPWVDGRFKRLNPHLAAKSGEIRYMKRDGNEIVWIHPDDYDPKMRLKSVTFIASTIFDNKILLQENPEYLDSLNALPTIDRERLLQGNWDIEEGDILFDRHSFKIRPSHEVPWENFTAFVRYWDLAATEEEKARKDSCFTAGALMAKNGVNGDVWLLDMKRKQYNWKDIEEMIEQTASDDLQLPQVKLGNYTVVVEQEPGATGILIINHIASLLTGVNVEGDRVTGEKISRSKPMQTTVERGMFMLREGPWNENFLSESEVYPLGFKDQVDSASGALGKLARTNRFFFA